MSAELVKSTTKPFFIGVDCGTGSVRAALLSSSGVIIASDVQPIEIWNDEENFFEQSSQNIWNACCKVVKKISCHVSSNEIEGIGFDATCSLVVLDGDFQPVSISISGDDKRNIVMWMDHRADQQATFINATGHPILKYVGGTMSLEMEPPKLLWLKQNLTETCWKRAAHFMDLADFLSWKATGSLSRSLCTLVCKWAFHADDDGQIYWDNYFWKQIGLEDLTDNYYSKIGNIFHSPGEPIKGGLSKLAAAELGLNKGTAVGASIIDAHAGGVGMLGASVKGHNLSCEDEPITNRLALILGTSSCHMAISDKPIMVSGVWGPYYSAMVPDYWLSEGGQSITGKLIDHMIETHPASGELQEKSEKSQQTIYDHLNNLASSLQTELDVANVAYLTRDLHIWPDHHGNRSPLADPSLKGMISGLSLGTSLSNLTTMYVATIQALAFGTRHIIDKMTAAGHNITTLFACGGLSKNNLFIQIHADVTGLPIVLPRETESVVVGAAILGACASGYFTNMQEAMKSMSQVGSVIHPDKDVLDFYERKYRVFLKMVKDQREYKRIMQL